MSNQQNPQPFGVLRSNDQPPEPGNDGARYYTIQRVNGNGANGKGDGTAGAHKHTIEESDKVKKSSIHRYFIKEEKEKRKSLVSYLCFVVMYTSRKPQACFFKAATNYVGLHAPRSEIARRRHCKKKDITLSSECLRSVGPNDNSMCSASYIFDH